ncbi:hypothetical protein BD626DRAFT_481432 [Schizophyllum amplum]|uniref:Uncharacterized protein n=1 Tax=Schizophyllum amplum TaxID=97359 RepID=A0A550CU79_9AGAR|nr:hypothetical protein BD626DRAFT_481432 [Auriculariopsis ampla]
MCTLTVEERDTFNTILYRFKHDRAYEISTTNDDKGARQATTVCVAGNVDPIARVLWIEKSFMINGIEVPWRCLKRKTSTFGSTRCVLEYHDTTVYVSSSQS